MKKFKDYLVERTMTYDMALQVFGMDYEGVNDKLALKKKWRDLTNQHHPDHGGDHDMIADVNDAYALLRKTKESKKGGVDWDAINAKYRRWGLQIKTALLSNFKPEVYQSYFKEMSGYDFSFEITRTYPTDKERSPSYAGFDVEFFTKDRNTVFTMEVSANLTDVISNRSLGAGDDISYNVYTTAKGFHSL